MAKKSKPKKSKWERYKLSKNTMESIVLPIFKANKLKQYASMLNCGTHVHSLDCIQCSTRHFHGYNSCKNRWCVPCQHRAALVWMAKLMPIFKEYTSQGYKISMLTFTVRNTDVLNDGINLLEDSWRKLYNGSAQRRNYFKERFVGGIRSLEVIRDSDNTTWHPHYHLLLIQPKAFKADFPWLVEQWKKITNGEGSCYITGVNRHNLLGSVSETIKYIAKPTDELYEPVENFLEAYHSLTNKRKFNTWGVLRGLGKEVEKDLDDFEERTLQDFICATCGCTIAELNTHLYNSNDFYKDVKKSTETQKDYDTLF